MRSRSSQPMVFVVRPLSHAFQTLDGDRHARRRSNEFRPLHVSQLKNAGQSKIWVQGILLQQLCRRGLQTYSVQRSPGV